jgi:hypothetical protein
VRGRTNGGSRLVPPSSARSSAPGASGSTRTTDAPASWCRNQVRCRFAYCRVATITRSRASANPSAPARWARHTSYPVECQAGASAARPRRAGAPRRATRPRASRRRVGRCVGERRAGVDRRGSAREARGRARRAWSTEMRSPVSSATSTARRSCVRCSGRAPGRARAPTAASSSVGRPPSTRKSASRREGSSGGSSKIGSASARRYSPGTADDERRAPAASHSATHPSHASTHRAADHASVGSAMSTP